MSESERAFRRAPSARLVVDNGCGVWLNEGMTTNAALRKQSDSNWITGTVDGLLVQAKCFDEPSHYGMELDGRISKLWVSTPGEPYQRVCLYNYDRGLDTDHLKPEALAIVVAAVAKVI